MSKATSSTYNLRSVMAMAWVYARMGAGKFGGSPRLYLASSLKQAWAEEKAEATRQAAKRARRTADARLSAALDDLELQRLAGHCASVNRHHRGVFSYGRGGTQGGSW